MNVAKVITSTPSPAPEIITLSPVRKCLFLLIMWRMCGYDYKIRCVSDIAKMRTRIADVASMLGVTKSAVKGWVCKCREWCGSLNLASAVIDRLYDVITEVVPVTYEDLGRGLYRCRICGAVVRDQGRGLHLYDAHRDTILELIEVVIERYRSRKNGNSGKEGGEEVKKVAN